MDPAEKKAVSRLKTLEFWIDEAERKLRRHCNFATPSDIPPVLQPFYAKANESALAQTGAELPVAEFYLAVFERNSRRSLANALDEGVTDRPNLPADIPEGPTMPEQMARLLRVVWADPRFWAVVRDRGDAPNYLRRHYQLALDFPAEVWTQMVRQPARRAYLFELLTVAAPHWFALHGTETPSAVRPEVLNSMVLAKLLGDYLDRPRDDHRPGLAGRNWPADVLLVLRSACLRLATDAAWCAKNPGQHFARRAPTPAHRVTSFEKARRLEAMVNLLRKQPDMSDYELAWAHFESGESTQRGLAKEAKELARLRDGIKVKQHKRRGS